MLALVGSPVIVESDPQISPITQILAGSADFADYADSSRLYINAVWGLLNTNR